MNLTVSVSLQSISQDLSVTDVTSTSIFFLLSAEIPLTLFK